MKLFITLLFMSIITLATAQNVGIGTAYPNNGRLVIKHPSNLSGLVVGDSSTGISFSEAGSPTINFNTYYSNGRKQMADGYTAYFYFNPSLGSLFFNSSSITGTQGTTPSLTNRMSVTNSGDVGINITNPTAGLHLRSKDVLIDNASGFSDIRMVANTSALGGVIELHNNSGIRTTALRAGDGSGISGELIFYDNTGTTSSLELDGDYAATGRSRIIVDELQIKGGADFAEYFDVKSDDNVPILPGMLVSIDDTEEGKMIVSNKPYDKKVAGVISGANGIKPGMMMGHKGTIANGKEPVALTGRVYVKAEALGGDIKPGDMLTTSSTPGFAMKVTNFKKATGAIIGKSMGIMQAGTQGFLLVLLNMQ